jgi:hypothetical protein
MPFGGKGKPRFTGPGLDPRTSQRITYKESRAMIMIIFYHFTKEE